MTRSLHAFGVEMAQRTAPFKVFETGSSLEAKGKVAALPWLEVGVVAVTVAATDLGNGYFSLVYWSYCRGFIDCSCISLYS